ncbi:MAG TPA: IS21 family transposase [Candidatus Binatia bacterium]|nr:IS21 family transposase [Candidatus Binatia bacterium]
MLTPEERHELQRLAHDHIPIRTMARRLGRDVKTIRRALGRPSPPPAPAKLAPYHALIQAQFAQGLRSPRILREIRARGYPGGATMLKAFLRTLGPPRPPTPRVFRRFETAPGEEAQSDWSPYRVLIADRLTVVHAFSLVLACSRRLFVRFFRDERLPTLLWAHQAAFEDHGGLCRRIAYDNQTAITLGRVGGRPRWHPTFLEFARHYGFEPAVGRPGHKERRGKVERPFFYLEEDFLRGRAFASWDDLHAQCRQWLNTVANVRVHGTTRRRVDEAYAEERPCLPHRAAHAGLSRRPPGDAHRAEGGRHPHRRLLLPGARRPPRAPRARAHRSRARRDPRRRRAGRGRPCRPGSPHPPAVGAAARRAAPP